MSGEASELGYDEVCVLFKIKNSTDAKGLDDTKALINKFIGAKYSFWLRLEDVKSDNIGKVITTYEYY